MNDNTSIAIKSLKIGDILLSTGSSVISTAIRASADSKYSHTALYIGNGFVIESIDDGVVKQSLQKAMEDDYLVSVYRMKNLTLEQAAYVVQNAKRHLGKPYDIPGAMGAGITSKTGLKTSLLVSPLAGLYALYADAKNRKNPTAALFCSELVALAFKRSGVPLGPNAASTTPEDITGFDSLTYMGDIKSIN